MRHPTAFFLLIIGLIALLSAALVFWAVFLRKVEEKETEIFSDDAMLGSLWEDYKNNYIEKGTGRVLDRQRNDITTSEGQSYALLRAVWIDDKEAFDQSLAFTRDNLQHKEDHLFSWKFGKRSDGTYGVITEEGGDNTASDANTDIALALIFAYSRWQGKEYLEAALPIIEDIWEEEVVMVNGKPYLAANNIERNSPDRIIINPSYLAPYAYRIFSRFDPNHPWQDLVDTSYAVLYASVDSTLDRTTSAGLPPDWVVMDRKTGILRASDDPTLTTHYSFDALRVPFRLALDWEWNRETRAKQVLEEMGFLREEWHTRGKLFAGYAHDGIVTEAYETPAFYGGNLGYFLVTDETLAEEIYRKKLLSLYDQAEFSWKEPLGYYDDNMVWFGMALYQKKLLNLADYIRE